MDEFRAMWHIIHHEQITGNDSNYAMMIACKEIYNYDNVINYCINRQRSLVKDVQ